MAKKIFWGMVALFGAISLAVAVGIVHPQEKVNAFWIIAATFCIYAIFYRFYSAFIAAKVLVLDPNRPTPAFAQRDGIDYHPTNKWVLFGHHFAAIAGAGPLIGPMLAAQFGYLPGFLWILIGAVLGGAVHDMVVLFASVRRGGRSLAQIAKEELGPVGGFATAIAILFISIVTLAGLGLAVVNALAESPWGAFTVSMSIPIALFMGVYLYKIRIGKIAEVSVIGVTLLILAVALGHYIPNSPLAPIFTLTRNQLTLSMCIYGFIASVLPVWLLLCPRDYLSTYMKLGTVTLLAIGIFIIMPDIEMPAVTKFAAGGGPIIPGKLFPFMFITIACGAISGFHSLIASGTTPKMISSERDIRVIGYGAMLAEGFVSIMALVAATILIPGDYFAINSHLTFDALAALGFPVDKINEFSSLVQTNVVGRPGGAVSLAIGIASILSNIPGMKHLMPYWYNFALMFEALFILTAVDTGTRVARFIVQEFGSYVYKPLLRPRWIPGIVVSSVIVVGGWGYLIYSGNISTIWPMFGIANQLLAATALGIGTTIIIKSGRAKYAWTTFVPMVFMFVTTITAAVKYINIFWGTLHAALVFVMLVLTIIILINMIFRWWKYMSSRSVIPTKVGIQ